MMPTSNHHFGHSSSLALLHRGRRAPATGVRSRLRPGATALIDLNHPRLLPRCGKLIIRKWHETPPATRGENGENTIMIDIITARAFALGLALAFIAAPAVADEWDDDAPEAADEWDDDALASDFLFGNHIDTHQQTRLRRNGKLSGVLLVYFTGEIDEASGLPVAKHPRGEMHDEVCGVDLDCVVGWKLRGIKGSAKFLFHSGVNGNDHPVWLVDRTAIPQPGTYSHFHWITSTGTEALMDGVKIPAACDVAMAGELEGMVIDGPLTLDDGTVIYSWDPESVHVGDPDPEVGAENVTCPGWFLQLKAVESFAFQHGGDKLAVHPGADNKTHLNLLTNYALVPGIDGTGGGGH
jgi:hypothetical protein